MSSHNPAAPDRFALAPPPRVVRDGRSASNASVGLRPLATSFAPALAQPGSFNPDLKSPATFANRTEGSRPDLATFFNHRPPRRDDTDGQDTTERRKAEIQDKIDKETKIKTGSENLLEALNQKNPKQTKDQRSRVESELNTSNRKLAQLKQDLAAEIEKSKEPSPSRLSKLFRSAPLRSPSNHELDDPFEVETESPTFLLAELLQALEAEGFPDEYYVERSNSLVDLFKRHPTLKYDLVWSIFGTRMQTLLLSDSREVVAASYRVLRHVITDRKSLSIIRSLHTDYLVILSLVKESKASVEREQALKFVRAFLEVKDGTREISKAIVRVIVAVAQHHDDRLKNICALTVAELLIRDPSLVVSAGGMSVVTETLTDREHQSADGMIHAILYLTETPSRRKHLQSGHELEGPFAAFTDATATASEEVLKANAKVIAALLKSWPGLFVLSRDGFTPIKSLITSLQIPSALVRDVILELVFDVLRIKHPSWSTSFLAGRRLTTYGRVATVNRESVAEQVTGSSPRDELVDHFTAVVLGALLHSGLIESLLFTIQNEPNAGIKRKATLLLGEILSLADDLLPSNWNLRMQVLPSLFQTASILGTDEGHISSSAIYQIDSVNRTLQRTGQIQTPWMNDKVNVYQPARAADVSKGDFTPQIDEALFRAVILETQVLNTSNFAKWRWDLIQKIIEGPLLNPKRLEEALKANKFVKRVIGFYRPFKYRFTEVRNTKPNQRYVRVGCSLFRTLLASAEGTRYLADHKMLRQVAECLAQVDRLSGLTSSAPLFSAERLLETLTGGYFAMLGVMSGSLKGLQLMERWKMVNMFYHIVELRDRDDLIKALLGNLDYTLDSQLRVIVSKALTSCSADVRIFSTRILRKYATRSMNSSDGITREHGCVEWAIQLLVTQLYDPEVEVCEIAIKALEEAGNDGDSLEYIVRCRPALDHLGEIGAPLLLRFLSTSTGYHYLDGLDYISHEMDDWFLGRNDTYVTLVEASLAKSLMSPARASPMQGDELQEHRTYGSAPPHFYRELTRTAEGCQLLQQKGHFSEFVAVVRKHGLESADTETMLKAKGAMWAVGNVGSMELGAPFLESTDAVDLIINIAEQSQVLSMRGTAFFVLGLISRSIHGQEILAEHGWDATVDETGCSIGICLPMDLSKLFKLPSQQDSTDQDSVAELPSPNSSSAASEPAAISNNHSNTDNTDEDDPVNARILHLVKDLGNTVLTKSRAAELHSIKAKKAPGFQQPKLFHKVMHILEVHRFRLPVLRFVFDLFDKRVLKHIVLDESEEEEDFESTLVG